MSAVDRQFFFAIAAVVAASSWRARTFDVWILGPMGFLSSEFDGFFDKSDIVYD